MKKPMKLKNIIKYLDVISNVIIWQEDVYTDKNEAEVIYEGSVLDIPWYILDMYLSNSPDGEAISARNYGDKDNPTKAGFIISVVEELGKE